MIITLAVTVVAVPLRTALFGGVTGSGADLFVAWMHSMGQNLVESVAITVIGANLVDKILTAVIVWLLLRQLPIRTTRHFPAMAAVLNASIYLINTVGIGGLHHAYPARADHFADL